MFTGIITDIGTLRAVEQRGDLRARIGTGYAVAGIDLGASIACDGVCLTVVAKGQDAAQGGWFDVDISAETVSNTNLSAWQQGRRVNLERALRHLARAESAGAVHCAQRVGCAERHLADCERGGWVRFRDQFHPAYQADDHMGRCGGGR